MEYYNGFLPPLYSYMEPLGMISLSSVLSCVGVPVYVIMFGNK